MKYTTPESRNDVFTNMYGHPITKYDAVVETTDGTFRFNGMTYSESQWAVIFRNNETTKVINKHKVLRMELTVHQDDAV